MPVRYRHGMRLRSLLLSAVAAMALAGCHEYGYEGSVTVTFGTGYVYYQSSGWYYEATTTNLVVTAQLTEYDDAEVEDVWWTPVAWPGTPPALSNPYATTTTMTFSSSGSYFFDFHVRYRVGSALVEDVHRLEVVVLPAGIG